MAHGSGGKATSELISTVFARYFDNPILARMEDAAVVPGAARIAMTTDSFVVTPLFFAGGDIGKLAVCGTVNDLAMSGATPMYLTCGFILEEGVEFEDLERIVFSMAQTAKDAGVLIVAGDTKVIEGKGGLYINTAGVGFLPEGDFAVSSSFCDTGDVILLSGTLGDHHAAILSARMEIENTIKSDCAPLGRMVSALLASGVRVKAMRDVTRGGLATVLHEFAVASQQKIMIEEELIPVTEQVQSFCGILGLDPLYMGNEGKMVAVVPGEDAAKALAALRTSPYGQDAAVIGEVITGEAAYSKAANVEEGTLLLHTRTGGTRMLTELYGEGLPRIC